MSYISEKKAEMLEVSLVREKAILHIEGKVIVRQSIRGEGELAP